MDPIFYTVTAIQGDYADLVSDQGQPHSITMFLLPEGTTVGSRLKLENFLRKIPLCARMIDAMHRDIRIFYGVQSWPTCFMI